MKGTVIKSTGSWYVVLLETNETVQARIKGKFRIQGIDSTNPVAVGDWVQVEEQEDATWLINDIQKRKNYIVRKSTNLSKRVHIIASNVDQLLLICTVSNPYTSTGFIDRYLVTAEAYHIPVVIVFNKVDDYSEKDMQRLEWMEDIYATVGYEVLRVSAITGEGVDDVATLLKDKVTLVSGHSGVGKSTLINKIDDSLQLKTGDVSKAHFKGKHTTTFAEMFPLKEGGFIIDTPGIKGFGLIDFDKRELSHYFPEMREVLDECKFNNCQHINEPQCAVKEAMANGDIAEERFKNYLEIYDDDELENYRK